MGAGDSFFPHLLSIGFQQSIGFKNCLYGGNNRHSVFKELNQLWGKTTKEQVIGNSCVGTKRKIPAILMKRVSLLLEISVIVIVCKIALSSRFSYSFLPFMVCRRQGPFCLVKGVNAMHFPGHEGSNKSTVRSGSTTKPFSKEMPS